MHIGIIGAGRAAQSFARKAIGAGHSVAFSNSRGPDSLESLIKELGPLASAATVQDVLDHSIVLPALPWPRVDTVLRAPPAWHGQILIDPTNALHTGNPAKGIVDFQGSSSSEHVAELAPGARVVKTLNTLFMTNFAKSLVVGELRRAALLSGDDANAKGIVADLLESFGFVPVDLGTLREGGRIQAVGAPIASHDFFLPWPAPRSFPAFNGQRERVS